MIRTILDKMAFIRRVRAFTFHDEVILILNLIRHLIDRKNRKLGLDVEVDCVAFRTVDLESLFIISPRYEEYMWLYLNPKKNEVFLDVGAHIGKYALKLAREFGTRVIAIEADPENYQALSRGIKLNNLDNVTALNIAAHNQNIDVDFYVAPARAETTGKWFQGKGWSTLEYRAGYEEIVVKGMTIDNIVNMSKLQRVDWIKLDVEKAEKRVLEGAKETLQKFRPTVLAECTYQTESVIDFMKDLDYTPIQLTSHYYLFKTDGEI